MKEGVVIKSTGCQYLVKSENEAPLTCRIKGKFRLEEFQSTNPVAVGDRVMYHIDPMEGEGIITEILERKNYIIRRATNLSKQTQILAANIDQALLLATINYPVTTTIFIDRFIASAEAYNIPVIIVFNKVDRYNYHHMHEMEDLMDIYNKIGYQTASISAKKQESLENVKELLQNRVTLIAGHSGAGKSTLVNRLEPGIKLKTADISSAHNTGRHTTTFAEMYPFSFGGYVIDTPGIGGFGLVGIEKEELYHFFKEIFNVSKNCRFHNCTHLREPGCAVKAAVDEGEIAGSRYTSYVSILLNKDEKYR